ncbi:MAG: hypothetical protein OXG49_05070, partial [Chloroflexi bacterium]|nr:hypothetical protein [Chloroflexota bacterium]
LAGLEVLLMNLYINLDLPPFKLLQTCPVLSLYGGGVWGGGFQQFTALTIAREYNAGLAL